ncbi:MAG: MBL fold metallo-hydrolase [Thermomicrobiales bacterium]|nr:MBL fold metallo-hydrolase [Thermomicrobiales bacterium]
MRYRLLRNATAILEYGSVTFLIDPALDAAGARPPVNNTPNQQPNPLVEMPAGWESHVSAADRVLQTHLHRDHFDDGAVSTLATHLPIYTQPDDVATFAERGFMDIRGIDASADVDGITITRVPAQHGTGEIAALMAPVSGYVLRADSEPTLYLASDTIWYDEVARVIAQYAPDVIVVNAGGARFLVGDPIVMTAADIAAVHAAAPAATIIIQHLEAINHCLETRAYYRAELPQLGVDMTRILIPEDGELLTLV